jgi:ATP-dependent RNA helicase DeaD
MLDTFEALGLRAELVRAVSELGYETPTPIQVGAIPALLEGRDVLGQAQTGTGKTAAFALPMLQRLDPTVRAVQAIILAPTRELASQVAEATTNYARHIGMRVVAIYGGTSYNRQLKQLASGAQIVVGTPGRTLDLIKQGSLDLTHVRYLVLDEADEMLSMGFIEDVEAIMAATPAERQTALFSATMPDEIVRLIRKYMREPERVSIARKTLTVTETEQRYYTVYEEDKLAALGRLLETEDITGALVFTRTKIGAAQLAEAMLSRGYPAEALHGDLNQEARETVLRRFRNGQLQILVATDVVARGIDIQGVSHVFNYDMPYDPEDYVHRIGRTGRAGRTGIAISLVTPRERRWLRSIESFTKQRMNQGVMPTIEQVMIRRDERFKEALGQRLEQGELDNEIALIEQMMAEGLHLGDIAAAAIRMARAQDAQRPIAQVREVRDERRERSFEDRRGGGRYRDERGDRGDRGERPRFDKGPRPYEPGMVRLQLNLGRAHGIQPGDIVGAIASEAGIPGRSIGAIDIRSHETFVDVKDTHVDRVLRSMERGTLRGQPIRLVRASEGERGRRPDAPPRKKFPKPVME